MLAKKLGLLYENCFWSMKYREYVLVFCSIISIFVFEFCVWSFLSSWMNSLLICSLGLMAETQVYTENPALPSIIISIAEYHFLVCSLLSYSYVVSFLFSCSQFFLVLSYSWLFVVCIFYRSFAKVRMHQFQSQPGAKSAWYQAD